MLNSTSSTAGRSFFIRHAPSAPRAADHYSRGVQVMSKRAALSCAHIQLQPSEMRASIAIDLDRAESYSLAREMDFPAPQLMMVNPANGHLHAIWQLSEGVTFSQNGRGKPQQAFLDLQRQITTMYGADTGYSHYMVKTPGHSRWETVETGSKTYSLTELLEAIPLGIKQRSVKQGRQVEGEGRHQTLFNVGRQWAYGLAQGARRAGSYDQWEARVLSEFVELNSFAEPLTYSQVKSLAKNVARWTWKNADHLNGSVMGGQKRSLLKSWDRESIPVEQAIERMREGGEFSSAVLRLKRDDKITQAIGQLAAQGITSPTQGMIAQQAGCSRQTVNAWVASQRAGKGN